MHYSFSDGLLSSSTYLVKEDESKRIFVNTYKELYYFNEAQGRFIDFDNLLRKKPNVWYEGFLYVNPNNQLILTRLNEINKNVVIDAKNEAALLTEIFGANYYIVNPKDGIYIPKYQNDVNFLFSNFDFANSDEIIFEYQFSGDRNWKQLDKGVNKLSFASLKAGSYSINYRILGNLEAKYF